MTTSYSKNSATEDIPEGWAAVKLGDLCHHPQYGWTTSAKHATHGLQLLRTTDISGGEPEWHSVPYCDEEPDDPDKYLLQRGDILVSRAGSVGISHLIRECPRAVFASYLIRLRAVSPIPPEFLRVFLRSPAYWSAVADNSAGIAVQNINASKLAELEVKLPPLAEQRRIVTKVEELLTPVNAARERLAKVPTILKRFRQSVLAAACSGQLTADWRAGNKNCESRDLPEADADLIERGGLVEVPQTWQVAPLDTVRDPKRTISYGVLKPGPFVEGGIPLLRIVDILTGKPEIKDAHRISGALSREYQRTVLQGGELLVSVVGSIGKTAVVPPRFAGTNVHRNLAVVAPGKWLKSDYLLLVMRAREIQRQVEYLTSGANQPLFNIGDLKRLAIPVAPLEEQAEIVRRVDGLFALADKVESRVQAATARVEKITQAILAKAFRGELVTTEAELARQEGRTYEPASLLLDRIRASRAAATTDTNPRSRPKKSAKSASTQPSKPLKPKKPTKPRHAKSVRGRKRA